MAFQDPATVVASEARTVDGDSGARSSSGTGRHLSLLVDVTAVGADANETLDLAVQWSHDGATFGPAETADAFAQLTQPGGAQTVVKRFDIKGPFYRLVWTLGGTTPSFTFSVSEYVT